MKALSGGVCLLLSAFLFYSTTSQAFHAFEEAPVPEEPPLEKTPKAQRQRPVGEAKAIPNRSEELKKIDGKALCEAFKKKHEKTLESFRAYNVGLGKLINEKKIEPFDGEVRVALDKEFHRLAVKLQDEIIRGLDPKAKGKDRFDCEAEASKQRLVEEIMMMNKDEMLLAYGKEMVNVSATSPADVTVEGKRLAASTRALIYHNDAISSSWVQKVGEADILPASSTGTLDTLRMTFFTSRVIKEIIGNKDLTEAQKTARLSQVSPRYTEFVRDQHATGIDKLVPETEIRLWRRMYLDRIAAPVQGQVRP